MSQLKNMNFKTANQQFDDGDFNDAFNSYSILANDQSRSKKDRSVAYGMMGLIVAAMAPYLGKDDETGLNFYMKALDLNPYNVAVLLNVYFAYGNCHDCHNDRTLFELAYYRLTKELRHELTLEKITMVQDRYEKRKLENIV